MQLGDDADAAAAPHVGGAELDDLAPSPPTWPRYGARRRASTTAACESYRLRLAGVPPSSGQAGVPTRPRPIEVENVRQTGCEIAKL